MAKLRCQCGHKFLIDFERLTVQSARKVRCPECGQSFPLAEQSLDQPASEVVVAAKMSSPSILSAVTNNKHSAPAIDLDEDDWPIAIPLSELRNEPGPTDLQPTSSKPTIAVVSWLAVLSVVSVLSTGVIFTGLNQQSAAGIVVTNLLLTGILFELWRIRRQLES
ncbi:MAG: hypothetical protein NT013_24720 [Planctomycetia bacterium]|nr:hypothetical protein [Planctomycetia bacterium]